MEPPTEFVSGIPNGITREDVENAILDYQKGVPHGFGNSTTYDLIYDGSRFPPKAILGLAARRVAGRILEPNEFSAGEDSQCFKILRELGFEIGAKPIQLLDDKLRSRLDECHQRLVAEEEMLTSQQLEQYLQTFRSRFGPDVLAGLDGEPLLALMHENTADGLAYWLEFKNDDEFPTRHFGSIAGGSALKFGVFRRKETGIWQTADKENYPANITVEEAITIARRHRDQLLQGVALLDELPDFGSDDDYEQLQQQMDQVAPDVSNMAWGHKYFSLLFPDKLDNFHNPEWRRFYLLKLLQSLPDGKGRYLSTGRFAAIAKQLGISIYALTATLQHSEGRKHRYWRVGTTAGPTVSHWPMMQENNCIAIGGGENGDLSWVESNKDSRKRLMDLLEKTYPTTKSAMSSWCSQNINFIASAQEGDVVVAAAGKKILGLGRITGDYVFVPEFEFSHQRKVEWVQFDEWAFPTTEGLQSTFRELRKPENILEIERRIQESPEQPVVNVPRLEGVPSRIQSVLERKGQVILYGPPGTGKTYWAQRTARNLAALNAFGEHFESLSEKQQLEIADNQQANGLVRTCCFHPGYGYEDFLEGYRPQTIDGQIAFELRDGIFKQLCRDAAANPQRKFYLVIDEINRGDIPRIFGELLTVLERDKRNSAIVLPVSQETFRVPQNVYLIGTMNTADRSISLLDAALRRRFGFIELMPDGSILGDQVVSGIPLQDWFNALNERIREYVGRDARNLQIGHSYLLQDGRPLRDLSALKRAIQDDVIPLIAEYCYEDFTALQNILGSALVDVDRQRIQEELFEDGQEENLIQALLEPSHEISASTTALKSDEPDAAADDDDEAEEEADEAGEQ